MDEFKLLISFAFFRFSEIEQSLFFLVSIFFSNQKYDIQQKTNFKNQKIIFECTLSLQKKWLLETNAVFFYFLLDFKELFSDYGNSSSFSCGPRVLNKSLRSGRKQHLNLWQSIPVLLPSTRPIGIFNFHPLVSRDKTKVCFKKTKTKHSSDHCCVLSQYF